MEEQSPIHIKVKRNPNITIIYLFIYLSLSCQPLELDFEVVYTRYMLALLHCLAKLSQIHVSSSWWGFANECPMYIVFASTNPIPREFDHMCSDPYYHPLHPNLYINYPFQLVGVASTMITVMCDSSMFFILSKDATLHWYHFEITTYVNNAWPFDALDATSYDPRLDILTLSMFPWHKIH